VRATATEIGDARRRVEQLLTQLPVQDDRDQLTFEQPWEIRAFALAVAAYQNGQYDWSEFQLALIDAIHRWEGDDESAPWRYYDRWLEALETVLSGTGVLTGTELDERAHTIRTTPRTADHHVARREPVAVDPARR
jgi:nitrile hydratase accessory protein